MVYFFLVLLISTFSQTTSAANCTADDVAHYANLATSSVRNGKLWGTKICTNATTANGFKCYNACARVVSKILQKAGCGNSITNSAKRIWDFMKGRFEPSNSQKKGCILGLNSRASGSRPRLTLPGRSGSRVSFRHVALATGSWAYVDNKSRSNTGEVVKNRFNVADMVLYSSALYLCPKR